MEGLRFEAVFCLLIAQSDDFTKFLKVINNEDPHWKNRYFFLENLEELIPIIDNIVNQELLSDINTDLQPLYEELSSQIHSYFN